MDILDIQDIVIHIYGYIRHSGHCYSYIKVNNKWFKFNDEYVHENIPKNPSNHVVGLYYIQC